MGKYDALMSYGAGGDTEAPAAGKYDALMAFGAQPPAAAPLTADEKKARTHEQGPRGFESLFGVAQEFKAGRDTAPLPDDDRMAAKEALARGALQGASAGFGDEAAAAIDTGVSKIPGLRSLAQRLHDPRLPPLTSPDATYAQRRDAYRGLNATAKADQPIAYLGGNVLGTLATSAAAPFSVGRAATIPRAILAGAKNGALYGGLTAAGESEARDLGGVASDALTGAATGAVTGGAIGGTARAVGKMTEGAPERIRKWVLKDVIGETRGATTKTAKVNLQRDANDVADVVANDPVLEQSLRRASGHKDADLIGQAMGDVQDKIAKVTAPRDDLYRQFKDAIGGGLKSGDYVSHLEHEADGLEASGKAVDRKVAEMLRKRAQIIRTSRDWGGNTPMLSAKEETAIANLEKGKAGAVARGEDVSKYDNAIANIRAGAKPAFNPDHIVGPDKVRENVTDLQKEAYESEGGLNGTPRYNRAREVASYAESYLDKLKAEAAKKNPQAMAALEEHDRQVSALLRVKDVLKQRLGHAQQESLGAEGEGLFGRFVHAAAHPKAGVIREGIAVGARGAIAARRGIDRLAAKAEKSDSDLAKLTLEAIRRGIPLSAAVEAAHAAGSASATSGGDE